MSKLQDIVERACIHWFPGERIWTNYRPDWLHGMEIDIYLPDRRIAIEVQGHQHYLFVPDLQKSVADFQSQRRRDRAKRSIIMRRGDRFFVVPCIDQVIGGLQHKLGKWLRRRLKTPEPLKIQWQEHRRFLNTSQQFCRYKVKRSGLIPINKQSAKALKATRKISHASNNDKALHCCPEAIGATQTTNPAPRVRIARSPEKQVAERVRLESASPQPRALKSPGYTDRPHPAMLVPVARERLGWHLEHPA